MPASPEAKVSEFLDQTSQTINAAFKAGAKMQEDMASFWSSALGQTDMLQQWQTKAQAMMAQAMPTMQKNADDLLSIWGQSYRSNVELMKKAFESTRCSSVGDYQAKMQDLWESSLTTFRSNAQAMTQANVRAMETWADTMKGNGHKVEEKSEKSAKAEKVAVGR